MEPPEPPGLVHTALLVLVPARTVCLLRTGDAIHEIIDNLVRQSVRGERKGVQAAWGFLVNVGERCTAKRAFYVMVPVATVRLAV